MAPIKILIADDHELFRRNLRSLIEDRPDWHVCGEAVDGREAVTKAQQLRPDLILMDVSMPEMNGLEASRIIREGAPDTNILIVSQNDPAQMEKAARKVGARGFVPKSRISQELAAAVERITKNGGGKPAPRPNRALGFANVRGTQLLANDTRERYRQKIARITLDSMVQFVGLLDAKGTVLEINQVALDAVGIKLADVEGKPFWTTFWWQVSDDINATLRESIRRAAEGEFVRWDTEIYGRAGGKETIIIDASLMPVKDESGNVVFITAEGRDITEKKAHEREIARQREDISRQKRSEQDVRASEGRFRAIVETTPECVKLVALDGTLLHMNAPGLRMVGARSPEQVLGKSIYSLIAPEHRDMFRAFNESVCRGVRGSLEFDIIGLEGKRRHMETHAAPLLGPDGGVAQLAVARDITERKQAEENLRQQKERFDLVANATEVGFWFCDLPFDKLTWDNRVKEHFWLAPDAEVTINTFYERLHPEDREPTRQAIARSNENDSSYDIEYRTVAPDGRQKWIRAMGRTFYDEARNPRRFDGVTLDITNLKHAEESHRKLAATLEQEVRTRTRQLEERTADVVRQAEQLRDLSRRVLQAQDEERRHIARELHDSAGQTLTVLGMNLAQLAQKAGRKAPELAGDAEIIQETVQQLHREIRTASYLLHPPLLDESGLYSALSWYVQGLSERSGLEITLDMSDKFGRLHRDMELIVFRMVQECLTNIHRHSGSKTAVIRIVRTPDAVHVEVQDHGKGMSMERLAEIQSKGSGVGILGMRERLRQFEGSLNIESGPKGTRILANIPIIRPAAVEPSGEPRQTIQ